MTTAPRLSTRQLLEKIPNYPCLYRHSVNKTYYGIKKTSGKRKEHSLETTDRKIAERKLRIWIADLDKVDTEAEKTTLGQLLAKFADIRSGKSESTKMTERGIVSGLKTNWKHGFDIRVSRIRPSMLDEWLAHLEKHLKNSSFNRYRLFLRQVFELAVNDKIISESPCDRLQKKWKKPEKPRRLVPTDEQFDLIVKNIRAEKLNADAEQSSDFIAFLGLAGVGQAEASSVTWGNVNWNARQPNISFRRQKTRALTHLLHQDGPLVFQI